MAGLEGRCNLLIQLGYALEARPDICASGRPGDMLRRPLPFDSAALTESRLLPIPLYVLYHDLHAPPPDFMVDIVRPPPPHLA